MPCEEKVREWVLFSLGKSEGLGLVQLTEEVALEGPNSSLVIPGENNAERKLIDSWWDNREGFQCQIRSSGLRARSQETVYTPLHTELCLSFVVLAS